MLSLEVLEDRAVPASLTFNAGVLAVVGDTNSANLVRFDAGPNAGDVVATVNGQTQTFNGVTQLVAVGGFKADDIANNTGVNMTALGLDGDDTIFGGTGTDVIDGGRGSDVIYDLLGVNVSIGGSDGGQMDRLYINGNSQAIAGQNDLVVNFFANGRTPGSATIGLELGVLYISPSNAGTTTTIDRVGNQVVVTYNFGTGTQVQKFDAKDVKAIAYFGGTGNDVFVNNTNIEDVAYGSAGNDTLVAGTGKFNLLKGSGGNDVLVARGKDADLSGNGGADVLVSFANTTTVRADNLDTVVAFGSVIYA